MGTAREGEGGRVIEGVYVPCIFQLGTYVLLSDKHFLAMFRELTAANDLEHRRAVNVPTLRVDGMTIAGA